MGLCENVYRRGAVYWWRGRFGPKGEASRTVAVSLRTRDPDRARVLGARLTGMALRAREQVRTGVMSIGDVRERFIEVGPGKRFYFDPTVFDHIREADAAREAGHVKLAYTLGREREMLTIFGRHVLDKLHRRAADVRSQRPLMYAEGATNPVGEAIEADRVQGHACRLLGLMGASAHVSPGERDSFRAAGLSEREIDQVDAVARRHAKDEAYPEAWQELTKKGEIRLKANYRKTRAQALTVEDTGRVSSGGHAYWFLPGRFRFCPSCGDYHTTSARDINRLAGLTAEGRSSATTVLTSSIVRWMNGPDGAAIPAHRRKVLAFTDNRQDAALQAGHFNDFAFVTQFRAAVLAALGGAGPDGIGDGEMATAIQKLLGFMRDRHDGRVEWLRVPELKGANLINAESDLRGVLLHRFWVDQRRGWRFTHPNLEELGFVGADYLSLDELVADEAMFAQVPDPLRHASPRERAAAFRILFDVLRKGLAVNAPSLDRHHVEDLKGRSINVHRAPWGFGRDEKPRDATWMMLAAPSRQDVKIRDEVLLLRGGPRSLLGRGLRAADLWGGASVTEQDYGPLVRAMLEAAKAYGLVSVGGTPFGEGEDAQGWRLEASAVRFRRASPDGAAGRGPPNPYFVALYTSLAARLGRGEAAQLRIEGREHTAQVTGDRREIREERFRFEKEDQDKLVARGEQLKDLGKTTASSPCCSARPPWSSASTSPP